jgi:hypothetical protein
MLFDRRQRRAVGVLVVASLVLVLLLGWGYLALAAAEEDRLVTKGVQQAVICGGPRKSGGILQKIRAEVPGAKSGMWSTEYETWGVEKDGDCKVWYHYIPGPAD